MQPGTEEPRSSLQQLIRQRRDAIVRAWEVAVRDVPLPSNLPEPLLRDEMPLVIERIAAMVGATPPHPAVAESAEKHALQRLGVGFELAHLLMEYSVLRNCILQEIADELQPSVRDYLALNQAIDAVANRSIERFSEVSGRLLKALDAISAEALQSKNLDDLLHRLLRVIMSASPTVDSVAILLKHDGRLQVRAAEGVMSERDAAFTIGVGEGFSGTIAERREPMLSRSAADDPRVQSEFIKLRKLRALYGVPLGDHEVIGVAHMASLTVHDFTHEEKLLFQEMAARASAAIIHTQLLERLEIERRLLIATVQQMPIGALLHHATGELLIANEAAERILHGKAAALSLAASLAELRFFDAAGHELERERWPSALALKGVGTSKQQVVVQWADGSSMDLEVSGCPVRDHEGHIVASVVVLEDVTGRKQAEAEREIYISSMSHDLRTPLSVIRMASETVLRRGPAREPDDAKAIERIRSNAIHMERLIQQLLDFARSRHAGGIPLTRRPTDLAALTRSLVDSLYSADADRVTLHAPGAVEGEWDPDRLSQLIQNLVGNALQHGRPDVPVEISVSATDGEALLSVTNGSVQPIAAELLPHVFDPFRKGSERGGLGLGLYISQRIAQAHGAEIQVLSDAERTIFSVALPRRAPAKGR